MFLDPASSMMTSTSGQGALDTLAVDPVLMVFFPRACASPRIPILLPLSSYHSTTTTGSAE